MTQRWTNADFDALSWHDVSVYGLRIDRGLFEQNDWHCELILDIDFIVAWVPPGEGRSNCCASGTHAPRTAPAHM